MQVRNHVPSPLNMFQLQLCKGLAPYPMWRFMLVDPPSVLCQLCPLYTHESADTHTTLIENNTHAMILSLVVVLIFTLLFQILHEWWLIENRICNEVSTGQYFCHFALMMISYIYGYLECFFEACMNQVELIMQSA